MAKIRLHKISTSTIGRAWEWLDLGQWQLGKLVTATRVSDLTARFSNLWERWESVKKESEVLAKIDQTLQVLGVNNDGNQNDFLLNLWVVESVSTGQEVWDPNLN